ncbi:MAG: lactonase family protein [Chloroflexi bacterium]|nr:lactonase family protein [Chloroflexota bacterium]
MPYHVYINLAGENKLSIYTMDPASGDLAFQEDVPLGGAPGPLAFDPTRRYLYIGVRSTSQLVSFRVERPSGQLTPLNTARVRSDPCYLATDRTGRYLLAAYYSAGRVTVHALKRDGALGSRLQTVSTAPHAHCIQTDASNRYAFVPHTVPSNMIAQFVFDARYGALAPNSVPQVIPDAPDGPRHFCFHPTRDIVYVDNEQGSSVTAYRLDTSTGQLSPFQRLSTLPEGFSGQNTCAQIHIHPAGRFLYASNRGHDSIACFAIDAATGSLTTIGQQPTEKTPRAFNLDPEGRFLLASGLDSGRLASYRIDQATGALQPLEVYTIGERPMWVDVEDLASAP